MEIDPPGPGPDQHAAQAAAAGAAKAVVTEAAVAAAARGLTVLADVWERAVEQVGSSLPEAQLRALLVIDRSEGLNLGGLALALGTSVSAASKLCSRLELADLVTRERAESSRREIVLQVTDSGGRLVSWVRHQRQSATGALLDSMSPEGREGLVRGLRELSAGQ